LVGCTFEKKKKGTLGFLKPTDGLGIKHLNRSVLFFIL
jgi:hypothetical protein